MTSNKTKNGGTGQSDNIDVVELYLRYQETRDATPASTLQVLSEASLSKRNETRIQTIVELAKSSIFNKSSVFDKQGTDDSQESATSRSWISGLKNWFADGQRSKWAGAAVAACLMLTVGLFLVPPQSDPRYAHLADCSECLSELETAFGSFRSSGLNRVDNDVRNAARAGRLMASILMARDLDQLPATYIAEQNAKLKSLTDTLITEGATIPRSWEELETVWKQGAQAEVYMSSKAATLSRLAALAYQSNANSSTLQRWQSEHNQLTAQLNSSTNPVLLESLASQEIRRMEAQAGRVEVLLDAYKRLEQSLGL